LSRLLDSQQSDKSKTGLGYDGQGVDSQVFKNQMNDKYNSGEGYHAVPSPYIGNFMPSKPNLVFVDEHVVSDSVTSLPSIAKSKVKTRNLLNKKRVIGKPITLGKPVKVLEVGLSARVESSRDEEILGEDASKQGRRIDAIASDDDITLVNDDDNEMFDVDMLGGEEMFVPGQDKNVVEEVVDAAQPKKKDQIRINEKVALKLQAKFNEEEKLASEKAEKEQEANIALIETWDDIQAKINDDHQLAKRLQVQEQEELTKLVERKDKRVEEELEQEITKKQKVEDDREKAELKQLMETISDEEEVAIDVIPLAVNSQRIVGRSTKKEKKLLSNSDS
nr:hypothetical protein [Tanacetum cinerariifolium]